MTEEQIADHLTGNWRSEHLFNLEQALKMYDQLCLVIQDYEEKILNSIISLQPEDARDKEVPPPASKSKAKNLAKRGQEPLREALYRLSGVDLTSIDGIGVDTAAVLISELGLDYSKFPNESHFISYLRLAPNLSISAGKKVPNKSKLTTCTRVSTALRMAALTLRNSKTALGGYYRRIARNKGASVAVFATARKLAELVYRMVCYGQAYVDTGIEAYEARFNQRRVNHYTNYLKSQGYQVVPIETQEACAA